MSSILKALKKLETESPAQEINGQYLPHTINTSQTVNKRVKGFWIVNKLFSIMCIVIITLGITWFALIYKSDNKSAYKANHIAEKKTDIQQPENTPEYAVPVINEAAKKSETAIKEPEKKVNNAYSSIPKNIQTLENTKPAFQPKKINPFKKADLQPVKPVPKEMPKPPVRTQAAINQVKKTIKPIPAVHEEKKPEKEKPDNTFSELPVNTTSMLPAVHESIPEKSASESGLDIQALVWSPEARSRMAVINGNILREGGVIKGAVINYIGNNYIIFKKESKEWKIIFQIN